MSLSGTFQEVESLEAQLNEVAKQAAPPPGAKKVFIAIPNMIDVNAMLVNKLFMYAMQHEFAVRFQIVPEVRFHDHARNRIAVTFMESDADYLVMVDADVDPVETRRAQRTGGDRPGSRKSQPRRTTLYADADRLADAHDRRH